MAEEPNPYLAMVTTQDTNITEFVSEITDLNEKLAISNGIRSKEVSTRFSPVPETILVTFVLLPRRDVLLHECLLNSTFSYLKEHLALQFDVAAEYLIFTHNGEPLEDSQHIKDIGSNGENVVSVEVRSSDPDKIYLSLKQEYEFVDFITVKKHSDSSNIKHLIVEVIKATTNKPFLGGYRHKITGLEFHHASAQTDIYSKSWGVRKFSRDTQTVELRNKLQQTSNDMGTQMTKTGVFVSVEHDKILTPREYVTADDYWYNIETKVIIIQKWLRRWLAKKRVVQIRLLKKMTEDWFYAEKMKPIKEREVLVQRDYERRMNPKTKSDFDLLFNALERWRREELSKINSDKFGAARKAALYGLLEQETQLLFTINKYRTVANVENRDKKTWNLLNRAAAAISWQNSDGKKTFVDTPDIIRARELQVVYEVITTEGLHKDERMDALLTLKNIIKEHDCDLTREILQLIEREVDLLIRAVKECNLMGLRKRIATLFLQFVRNPLFNPQIASLLEVPHDISLLRKDIYRCSRCRRYLPSTDFQLSVRSYFVGLCRDCRSIENEAVKRKTYNHYKDLLNELRKSEDIYYEKSKIVYLLKDVDICYLVENIWDCQSIISGNRDLYNLIFMKWNKHDEWSPWNCIFLTRQEAAIHLQIKNIPKAYTPNFIRRIEQKHALAKVRFSQLPAIAEMLLAKQDSVLEYTGKRSTGVQCS